MDLLPQLKSFESVWHGGYYEGDPLDPLSGSSYGEYGYMSVLYATYLFCIKPYINSETIALEIGPGRGAWTKPLLEAKEVWTLDALSANHNKIYDYLGPVKNLKYIQVNDYLCNELPDNYFDYMFSFGCLCHVPIDGVKKYIENLHKKLKKDAICFWMISDYDKYINCVNSTKYNNKYKILQKILFKFNIKYDVSKFFKNKSFLDIGNEGPAKWTNLELNKVIELLIENKYKIISKDIGVVHRDPIIMFTK